MTPITSATSVPWRTLTWWSANAAVFEKRGSMTSTGALLTSLACSTCCIAIGCDVQMFSPQMTTALEFRMSFIELVIAP